MTIPFDDQTRRARAAQRDWEATPVRRRLRCVRALRSALWPMTPATRAAGAQLAEADVDHVVFTGSAAVGRKLAARLGERLVSSTLELTGCDAQFVLDDADVNLAARAAWFGATVN